MWWILLGGFGEGRVDLHWGHFPLLEGTILEPVGVLGVQLPKPPFPWFTLLPRHLDEALVQGEVVPDRVLEPKRERKPRLNAGQLPQHLPAWGDGWTNVFSARTLEEKKTESATSGHPGLHAQQKLP